MIIPDTTHPTAKTVLEFWFNPSHTPFWFVKSEDFYHQIKVQFSALIQQIAMGETADWRTNGYGRCSEIIVLDQFTRNIYRNTAQAFAYDSIALILAQEAIAQANFYDLPIDIQKFSAIPLMHSESKIIHQQAVEVFEKIGDQNTLDFEHRHKVIIDRFGRYPHRNAVLGRVSTAEEEIFLQGANSSF